MSYEKPVIVEVGAGEGIYMSSGSTCYTTTAYIHQRPETGRDDYRIQINAKHNGDHTRTAQTLVITFNQPVQYVWCNGNLKSGDGTNTLMIGLNYYQNPTDNIGLGDLVVKSESGLDIISAEIYD